MGGNSLAAKWCSHKKRSIVAVVVLFAIILLVLIAPPVGTQELGEFYHELRADGTPLFTQVLRWAADPNVRFYTVTIQTVQGTDVVVSTVNESAVLLHLAPGRYRYRIVLHNLLGDPELEIPWIEFTVLQALLPRISTVSPRRWFLDRPAPPIRITGEALSSETTVILRGTDPPYAELIGTLIADDSAGTMQIQLPTAPVPAGSYHVVVVNPGGLTGIATRPLAVYQQRVARVATSLGYAPWISLYDAWYTATWPGTIFPIGFAGRVTAYLTSAPFGELGVEVSSTGRHMTGGNELTAIGSGIGQVGFTGIFRRAFTNTLSSTARIGGGLAMTQHSMRFGNSEGTEIAGINPFLTAGMACQYRLSQRIYLEVGLDWLHTAAPDFTAGGLSPQLSVGIDQ